MAAGVLLQFTHALGQRIHERLHGLEGLSGCSFNPERCAPAARIDCRNPGGWTPSAAVGAWSKRYVTALTDSHDVIVERAKQRLGRETLHSVCRCVASHASWRVAFLCCIAALFRRREKRPSATRRGFEPSKPSGCFRLLTGRLTPSHAPWDRRARKTCIARSRTSRECLRGRSLDYRRQTLRSCRPASPTRRRFRCPPPASREMGFLRNGAITTCGVEFDA